MRQNFTTLRDAFEAVTAGAASKAAITAAKSKAAPAIEMLKRAQATAENSNQVFPVAVPASGSAAAAAPFDYTPESFATVSYTHLTLPTIYSV